MHKNTTPMGVEQELITLHDGTTAGPDDRTLELDGDEYTPGQLALEADVVADYAGRNVLLADCITFTRGKHEGGYALDNDGDVVELLGDNYCHEQDSYETTYDGDKFFDGDEDDLGLVKAADTDDWHYKHSCTACIVGGSNARNAESGYVYNSSNTVYNSSDSNRYWDDITGDFDIERDSDGDYYFSCDISHDDDDEDYRGESGNADYHELERRDRTSSATKFTVGFEVEKEDYHACRIGYGDVYSSTGWVKEEDGSLNGTGYELVTPTLDLFTDRLDTDIAGNSDLQQLLGGGSSDNCGGHINFGIVGQSGAQVCDATSGWFPLIYAMFPGRASGGSSSYAAARKLETTKLGYNSKGTAVVTHHNRIEFRVFSAVKSVKHLLWRRDFMRLLATNLTDDPTTVLEMVLDSDSALHVHLRKVYTEPKLLELVGRAVTFYHNLEDQRLNVTLALTSKKAPQLALPLENVSVVEA